ncbi:MAG: hypothetical protein ACOCQD_02375 [archaeon]
MSLLDSLSLGNNADEIENTETQEEVLERHLYEHNQMEILRLINIRASKYELEFLFSKIEDDNMDFWNIVLKRISHRYKLNNLLIYTSTQFSLNSGKPIKDILLNIKVDLMDKIMLKEIDSGIPRDDLLGILSRDKKFSSMLSWVIKVMEIENYRKFIKTLFEEYQQNYEEDTNEI